MICADNMEPSTINVLNAQNSSNLTETSNLPENISTPHLEVKYFNLLFYTYVNNNNVVIIYRLYYYVSMNL